MKTFQIEDKIYRTNPLFVTDCTMSELKAYLAKKWRVYIDVDSSCMGSVYRRSIEPYLIVWVNKSKDLNTAAHELFHLTTSICQVKQIPIIANLDNGECGDEAAAYLFEYFFSAYREKIR